MTNDDEAEKGAGAGAGAGARPTRVDETTGRLEAWDYHKQRWVFVQPRSRRVPAEASARPAPANGWRECGLTDESRAPVRWRKLRGPRRRGEGAQRVEIRGAAESVEFFVRVLDREARLAGSEIVEREMIENPLEPRGDDKHVHVSGDWVSDHLSHMSETRVLPNADRQLGWAAGVLGVQDDNEQEF